MASPPSGLVGRQGDGQCLLVDTRDLLRDTLPAVVAAGVERCAGTKIKRVPTSSLRYLAEDVGKYVIKTIGRDPKRTFPSYANWDGRTFAARFDASRAKEKLGWRPTVDREAVVREGIRVPAEQFLG